MERIELERWGVTPLDERELLVHGGGRLKKLLEVIDEVVKPRIGISKESIANFFTRITWSKT